MSSPDSPSGIPTPRPAASTGELTFPTKDECTIAMLAHVLQAFSWFIAPLIIYLVKRESRFVRFHALQALIWQIIILVALMTNWRP